MLPIEGMRTREWLNLLAHERLCSLLVGAFAFCRSAFRAVVAKWKGFRFRVHLLIEHDPDRSGLALRFERQVCSECPPPSILSLKLGHRLPPRMRGLGFSEFLS